MGDRIELNAICAYCGEENKEVWYAPTCSSDTFPCSRCGKTNFIDHRLKIFRLEDISFRMVRVGFEMASNAAHKEEDIMKMCKERFINLLKDLR